MSKLGMIVVFATMVGCGTDGAGTGPISAANAQAGCEAGCEHDKECDPTSTQTVEACTAECVAGVSGGGVREDAFEELSTCVSQQACTASDDACFTACEPTSAHESFEAACRAKLAECGAAPTDLDGACETKPNGDDLGFLCLFTPAVMNELAACMDLACTAIEDCYGTVSAKYGLN